ncbi:MarR family transcriptional regulator [Tsukamurella sp. 8F]|uniref:MarR family winged helix-turn-helix transcriptional regulator n=1 Tax=unclassified Tsukamurella TaxID=2633480 RepID=UPI0023B9F3B0|nr:MULTISPECIES: MarR family transcriptional regulator [unclassified Tsukamurella]MDF0528812.1 MarR family transcriptional regulator [Tsukamurella sp. 8J]MDF0586647.1 MarR family transcriptional regulator [Tsukamurella sp. 8F]
MPDPTPGELLGREFITAVVMFHEAVGRSLGLTAVERKTLDVLRRLGPVSASQLVEHTGLTSGAVTGLVDRLVRRGFAERAPDSQDRRRILVTLKPDPALDRQLADVFGPLGADMAGMLDERFTPEQQQAISDFQRATTDILRRHTARLSRGDL